MKKKTQAAPAKTPAARPSVVDDSILLSNRPSLRITDTTLRDAPQSLWATRIRTSDIAEEGVAPVTTTAMGKAICDRI